MGGIPTYLDFFLKQTSKFDFRAQTNFKVPYWLDDMSREGRSRSQRTCIKGAHVGAKFKRFPEQGNESRSEKHRVQGSCSSLGVKGKAICGQSVKGRKERHPFARRRIGLYEKRREEKAMKKSGTRRVPKEHVGIVLARQKEIEAQF